MPSDNKLYEILGVSKDADEDAIRKAYKKLAVKYHPDKHQNSPDDVKQDAENKFKEISRAYSILSDPEKREKYDRFGEEGVNGGNGPDINPADIFSHFFGGQTGHFADIFGGGHHQQPANMVSPNKEVRLNIDLLTAFRGNKIMRSMSRREKCPDCDGQGCKSAADINVCGQCKGAGMQTILEQMGPFMRQFTGPCRACSGKGKSIKPGSECGKCKGQKSVNAIRNYTVDIPGGTLDGFRFVFKGESDWQDGFGQIGDLIFVIAIDYESGIFKREGVHLVVNKRISLVDSLCGVNFGIKHLDNRIIHINHGGIIKHGDSLVAEGEGMPILTDNRSDGRYTSTGQKGNLIIRFEIVYPASFSDKHKEALRKVIKQETDLGQSPYININVDGLTDPKLKEQYKIVIPKLAAEVLPDFGKQTPQPQQPEMPHGVQCANQ